MWQVPKGFTQEEFKKEMMKAGLYSQLTQRVIFRIEAFSRDNCTVEDKKDFVHWRRFTSQEFRKGLREHKKNTEKFAITLSIPMTYRVLGDEGSEKGGDDDEDEEVKGVLHSNAYKTKDGLPNAHRTY